MPSAITLGYLTANCSAISLGFSFSLTVMYVRSFGGGSAAVSCAALARLPAREEPLLIVSTLSWPRILQCPPSPQCLKPRTQNLLRSHCPMSSPSSALSSAALLSPSSVDSVPISRHRWPASSDSRSMSYLPSSCSTCAQQAYANRCESWRAALHPTPGLSPPAPRACAHVRRSRPAPSSS